MTKQLLLALAVLPLFVSCKKDDDKPKSKTELLTDKNWRQTAGTADPGLPNNGTIVTDYFGQLNACAKDNIDRFEKPNVYKSDEGTNVCTGSTQTTVGTWVFSSDESKITVTAGSQSLSMEIVELTETTLKVKYPFVNGTVTHNITDTYTKL